MKLVKSLLLGSAAGLAAVAGAQAADLPSKKAAPVEYVRVCSAHGAGFFYIPGSDTCIKLGGLVRLDAGYAQTYNRRSDMTGSIGLGRFELDARNSTEFGLLRAFTRVDFRRATGALTSGTAARVGYSYGGTAVPFGATTTQTRIDVSRAFVQLGGLTAGRTVSFFGFYNADLEITGTTIGDGLITNALAYTATFGSGFSATLSMEDPLERRNIVGYAGSNSYLAITGAGTGTGNTYYAYGGAAMPEFVGALRVDQGWGSAQLSAAIHQIRTAGGNTASTTTFLPTTTSTGTPGYGGDQAYGYALNLGAKINLPMIAAGDALYLQGTYTNGASAYATSAALGNANGAVGIGKLTLAMPDAVITGTQANPSLSTVQVWGLTAGLLHYWTPTIRQALFGSYGQINIPGAATVAAGGVSLATNGLRDSTYWTIGSNVIWSPIKGLDIGAELNYQNLSGSGQSYANQSKVQAAGGTINEGSVITSRIRVQRSF